MKTKTSNSAKARKPQIKVADMKPRRNVVGGRPVQYMNYKMTDVLVTKY